MLVDPEVSPCAGALAEADSEVIGMLAEEPAGAGLFFDVSSACDSVWPDPALRHMRAHPEYLAVFTRTQHFIMRGDGPLPFDVRHYIAIMAAGRHQCQPLLDQLQEEFLASGGEPRWLEGLHQAPRKLRDLDEVNRTLAHRPWLLGKAHIERLARRGRDNWSLGELLQALTILAHYHAVSSFVHGCRLVSEPAQTENGATKTSGTSTPNGAADNSKCPPSPSGGVPVGELMQRIQSLNQGPGGATAADPERPSGCERVEGDAVTASASGTTAAGAEAAKGAAGRRLAEEDDPHPCGEQDCEEMLRRDGTGGTATFRVQDYSWEDHGFSLVNRLYSDVGFLLDDKFRTAYDLTYQTMGTYRAVDTRLFRRAIWRYIQCLFGIRHDDYDYSVVSELLDRRLKELIRTACQAPERLDPALLRRVMPGFQRSEKIHVVILCLEARLQSELLYALRAVMRYTT